MQSKGGFYNLINVNCEDLKDNKLKPNIKK